jgi:P2-related tail formation protein
MTVDMDVSAILPPNATPFERAVALAASDDLPVPIREVFDPAQTPIAFLPWLAVHDGVLLWFSDWAEARKRQVIDEAPVLAGRIGTRSASIAMLGYVDGDALDIVSYPARFIFGRARTGRTPIGHPPWLARHLVRVWMVAPARSFVMGRGVLSSDRLKTPDREALRRCLVALATAKSPETEYRADFGHKRELLLSDAPLLDGSYSLGAYVARNKL